LRAFVGFAACTAVVLASSLFSHVSAAPLRVTPTTTLTAETSNNTSAASTFKAQSIGNVAPGNVSKVPTRTLLYPGATTKIYTNIMHWFGPSNHMQVGYNSADPAQVQRQIDDHVSRGLDGTIVDWYGPGKHDDIGTQLMMRYAETLPGLRFKFAIMEDKGALLSCSQTFGCDLNKKLISDLTYIYNTYQGSPAYMKFNGQPVVFFFGLERYTINWDYVKANVPGNPLFIFQNSGGYTHPTTAGAFSWVMINTSDPNDWKQSYLYNFYVTAQKYPGKRTFGTTYKGFNDTLAAWSLNRIMNQNCGQTWLNTWQEVGRHYSSSRQLEAMQIVTWNDYEEGTEIETGIENCVAISASVAGDRLSWSINGYENTIDHYTVYVSEDGENLMPLVEVSTGLRSVNLAQFGLAPGNYTLFVKAVAKPSMTNKMSRGVSYSVYAPEPTVVLNVTPTSGIAPVTVTSSTAGSTTPSGTITSSTIDFGDGTVASATTASHTYTWPGTYTITATVTNSLNVSATKSATVSVVANKPPLAYISVSPASGIAPVTVTASTAASSDADGSIASSTINFGDGTVVNATTASHTYQSAGTYTVTGIVQDNLGATANATATVTVAPVVQGSVTVSSPAPGATVGSPVRFVASATANTGNRITSMRVYVDGVSAYTAYSDAVDTSISMGSGAHNIVVQAWDNTGLVYKTAMTITVAVNKAPVVSLSVNPTSTTTGTPVTVYMAGTKDLDGTVARYTIDFGDGFVAYSETASHAYSRTGTFMIKATATDNSGASSTLAQTITISAPVTTYGVVVKSPRHGTKVGSPVRFIASATSKDPITAMRIYVNGVSAYTVNAAYLDTSLKMALGTHNVVVQAWDSMGAVYKSSLSITVP